MIINSYLALLKKETNESNIRIFSIPSYAPVHWERSMFDTFRFRSVPMEKYDFILLPINVRSSHWLLLAANVMDGTVSILDSLPNERTACLWFKRFTQYMESRAQFTGDLSHVQWTRGNLKSARQRDGHSCGAFVMLNALAIVRQVDPRTLGDKAAAMRVHVQHRLLDNAISLSDPHRVCDFLTCALSKGPHHKKEQWVKCDVCGRWLHLQCVSLKKPPPAEVDYVCPVCSAQYS